MKKPGQVQRWIKAQSWWPQFKANFRTQLGCTYLTMTELLQKSYQEPIASAFLWDDTPEGFDFWNNIDKQFLDFYYGKTEQLNG